MSDAAILYYTMEEKTKLEHQEKLVVDLFGIINLLILSDRRHLEDHLCTLHQNLATFTKNDSYDYGQAANRHSLLKVPDETPNK